MLRYEMMVCTIRKPKQLDRVYFEGMRHIVDLIKAGLASESLLSNHPRTTIDQTSVVRRRIQRGT